MEALVFGCPSHDLANHMCHDCVPHDLMVKAVEANTDCPWVLYVTRWLTADLALPDGTLQDRARGTPQSSAMHEFGVMIVTGRA